MARERNYSEGWVAHKMREKFGAWPRGLSHVEEPVTAEVSRWVKSRQIAWAKARKKESVPA
jgi:DNA repair protein RadD